MINSEGKSTDINELLIEGKVITDAEIMAEQFNLYFTGLAKALSDKIPPSKLNFSNYLPPSSLQSFALLPTSPAELITINKILNDTHTPGTDDLNPHTLSSMLDLLADPLSEIINCSLRNGTVPLDIKLAKVLPI